MKKYLAVSVLFLANNEILSLLALTIITVMFLFSLIEAKEARG